VYAREALQKMSDALGFTAHNTAIEDARCEADLMYALFRRPHTVAPKILAGFLEIIKKKNSPKLEQSRMFRDAMEFLTTNPNADNRLKIYYILMVINREVEAKDFIRTAYIANHRGNMWGERNYVAHFERFTRHLSELVENASTSTFGAGNIIEFVRSFVLCAEQLYMTK
jgi:hypothetical protein